MIQYLPKPIIRNIEDQKKYRWQVAITILIIFIIGTIVSVPFTREIKRLKLEPGQIDPKLSESIIDTILTISLTGAVFGIVLIFIGLWVAGKSNLGAPGITAFFSKRGVSDYFSKKIVISCITIGALVAFILLGWFEIQNEFYPVTPLNERPSRLFYILASFSGAISEEVMFRLGIMSLIIAVIQYLKEMDVPSNKIIWVGIILSSILFGIIHIPMTSNFSELTAITISVTILGNMITGTTFGWIFWKWGLLNAILAHFIFDIVFHVLFSFSL